MKLCIACIVGALSFSLPALASPTSFTVNAYDTVYGAYTGTAANGGSFEWNTAGYHINANIGLTYNGVVIGEVVTQNNSDVYELYTSAETNTFIGGSCTGESACVSFSAIGSTISLYNTINSLNGNFGICCDQNGVTPQITLVSVADVPEPASLSILGTAVLAVGVGIRRKANSNAHALGAAWS